LTDTSNLNADPLFVRNPNPGPDGNWGTVDDDYGDLHLRSGSPAINTGSNAAVPTGTTTDLAGNPRLVGSRVDLGAYETPDQPVTVTFATSAQTVSENAGTVTLTLKLSQPLATAMTVPLLLGGTAIVGRDCRLLSPNPLVFEPGSTSLSFNIEIFDDQQYDPGKTVLVHLGEPTNAWYGSVATHTIAILDNEAPPVLYVDDTARGANNGSSWADAYRSLQAALQAVGVGAVICVAAGTYKPGTLRTDSFQLKNHVAIYGGFPEGGGTWQSAGHHDRRAVAADYGQRPQVCRIRRLGRDAHGPDTGPWRQQGLQVHHRRDQVKAFDRRSSSEGTCDDRSSFTCSILKYIAQYKKRKRDAKPFFFYLSPYLIIIF
jgi:hypothetical protein